MHESPGSTPPTPRPDRLSRGDKVGLVLFGLLVIGFGVITDIRSAFQSTSKTDFGVYARAAWAARIGADVYIPTDNNGWHYNYPPTFAILMIPLADPYPFLGRGGYLPFGVSVAIWYVFSVWCVWAAVHTLATAVLPGAVRGSRRWWYARVMPVYVCIGAIGLTLGRGQVNALLVALVAAGFAASVRGRRLASGAWLAGAAALKIIPGLLVLYPLARRDGRAIAGGVVAAVVLLGLIPAAVWGVPRAIEANKKTVSLILAPAVAEDADQTRMKELHGAKATDNQSVQGAVQAWLYPDRSARPDTIDPVAKWAHWGMGGLLLAVTLLAGRRRLTPDPADQLVFLGALCAVMMLLTPISHMHYYAMVLPLVCGLWLRGMSLRPGSAGADPRTTAVLVAWGALTAIPLFPGPVFDWLRECGFGTAATIGLWAFGLGVMGRKPAAVEVTPEPVLVRRAA
ncbi:MAG: hypothetical protein JWO38_3129 [Gemmataceae bacterium]|nr:hypothetical protein [Gemmataceae bacterium]